VKSRSRHRRHAVRVAAVATLIVMVFYVIVTIGVNLIVSNHLMNSTDNRLADRLEDARQQTLALPGSSAPDQDADLDDAPVFIWSIAPSGTVTALTSTAPPLPSRRWGRDPVTLRIGGSTLRFDTLRSRDALLVAAQSTAATSNVQSTLVVAEFVFGVILAVAVFAGATVVGLRASAPSELVRRRQAEFTADASHELRTPISVIEAEVGLALDRPRDPTAYREALERVRGESTRLRRIVEDLLWLARADSEQTRPSNTDRADLGEVVEGSVERFGVLAASRGIDISLAQVGEGPFTVQAQPDLVDRLAGVLIDNACKFAGEDGRVEVSVRDWGTRVDLRVDDSGPGIPEDQRDAVFDRFHRATDKAAGTGLGLAIADSVVRSTDGKWAIGVADLGGARLEVSWRKAPPPEGMVHGDPCTS
jgi:two-component system, OmpR family, sensor histidine kinase CiaH